MKGYFAVMDFSDPLAITRMTGIIKNKDRKPGINIWIFVHVFPLSVWLLIGFSVLISLFAMVAFDVVMKQSSFLTLDEQEKNFMELCLGSKVRLMADIVPWCLLVVQCCQTNFAFFDA